MFNPLSFNWNDRNALVGNLYLVIAAALWAGVIIHVRAHHWTDTPLALAPWQMFVGLGPLVALAWFVEGPPPTPTVSLETMVLVIYSGPLITAFPFWALITVSKNLPALTTSLTLLLMINAVARAGHRPAQFDLVSFGTGGCEFDHRPNSDRRRG